MSAAGIGTIRAQFVADNKSFDASIQGTGEQLKAAAAAAALAGNKVASAGEKIDRTARLQEQALERARAAWEREQFAAMHASIAQDEANRAKQMAALRNDIEARSAVKAAEAQEILNRSLERQKLLGEGAKGLFEIGGLGLGAVAVAEGVKEMFLSTMEAGVELNKLRQETGISAENLSVLKFAAQENGVEFEGLARAFKHFATTVAEADSGNQAATKGFAALGISAVDVRAKGNDMYGVMTLVADKFKEMPDGIQKSAAASLLFGRAGQDLIPILNQGADALEALKRQAPMWSDDDFERMHKMHEATESLNASWMNMKLSIVGATGPAVSGYLNDFAAGLDVIAEKAKEAWKWVHGVFNPAPAMSHAWAPDVPPGVPSPPAKPVGTDEPPSYPYALTIDPNRLRFDEANRNSDASIANEDANREAAAKAEKDAADAWKEVQKSVLPGWLSQIGWFSELQDAFGPMQGVRRPNVTLAQPAQAAKTALDELRDSIAQTTQKFSDLGAQLSKIFNQSLGTVNDAIIKSMVDPHARGTWSQAGRSIFSGVAKSGLELAEGSLFGGLGKMGTKGNPMWVSIAGVGGVVPAIAGTTASSGGGGIKGFLTGLLGILPHFASGGYMPAGPAVVGERGIEVVNFGSSGHVTPGSRLGGGDTHHHWNMNIDARGSHDPAAVGAQINRAMEKWQPKMIAATIAVHRDLNSRVTRGDRI